MKSLESSLPQTGSIHESTALSLRQPEPPNPPSDASEASDPSELAGKPSPSLHHSTTPSLRSGRYSIRRHTAFWSLTFNGQEACFDHEQGAYYVAYLLLNPPDEPIHGMALEVKALAYFDQFRDLPCATEIVDPKTGRMITLEADATVEQRNLALDDNEGQWYLSRKQLELEAILEDDTASEPVKAEVMRELEELAEYLKAHTGRTITAASKAVRAVREAIRHFHQNLATATDPHGNPHPVLRPFAQHLQQYQLIPTVRYSRAGTARTRTGVAGAFTYEPPNGVKWTA